MLAVIFGCFLTLNDCNSRKTDVTPTIEFTKIPPAAEGGRDRTGTIAGRVSGASPGQQIVLYAHAGPWYVQPRVDDPFTVIQPDSTWSAQIHLGYEYAALLVNRDYHPPATMDLSPTVGGSVILVKTTKGEGSLHVFVLPAFYQTNWFHLLSVATFVALLWGSYELRVQRLRRQFNIRLEARVNERTRIARELHDTLLQTFHGALFQFQAARNLMRRQPDEAMRSLDDAITETKKALAESREAIQDLRSEPIAKGNLPELLMLTSRELADSHANEHPPVFDLIEEGDRKTLSSTVSGDICRIALELTRNAYRHARAKRIEAELRYGDSMFRLRIRDDGGGIDPKVLNEGGRIGHWGLRGVRERAERIGASLHLWSEPGGGTEVQLLVPAEIAYENVPRGYRAKLVRRVKSRA